MSRRHQPRTATAFAPSALAPVIADDGSGSGFIIEWAGPDPDYWHIESFDGETWTPTNDIPGSYRSSATGDLPGQTIRISGWNTTPARITPFSNSISFPP